jgi:hypothetical protein
MMGGKCSCMKEFRNAYRILVGRFEFQFVHFVYMCLLYYALDAYVRLYRQFVG